MMINKYKYMMKAVFVAGFLLAAGDGYSMGEYEENGCGMGRVWDQFRERGAEIYQRGMSDVNKFCESAERKFGLIVEKIDDLIKNFSLGGITDTISDKLQVTFNEVEVFEIRVDQLLR
ncbi:MAG: hypothetical protein NTX76_03090 [Alphaproteobacteria bacterium]|nr:hypothetical protein [Alphaproteobacteria bacterium]